MLYTRTNFIRRLLSAAVLPVFFVVMVAVSAIEVLRQHGSVYYCGTAGAAILSQAIILTTPGAIAGALAALVLKGIVVFLDRTNPQPKLKQ